MTGRRLGDCCICDGQRGYLVPGCRVVFEGVERLPPRASRAQRGPVAFRLEGPLCQECANLLFKRLKGVVGKGPFVLRRVGQ